MPGSELLKIGVANSRPGKLTLLNGTPKPQIKLTRTLPPAPTGPFYYDVYLYQYQNTQAALNEVEVYDENNVKITNMNIVNVSDNTYQYNNNTYTLYSTNDYPTDLSTIPVIMTDGKIGTFDPYVFYWNSNPNYESFAITNNVFYSIHRIFTIESQTPVSKIHIYFNGPYAYEPSASTWNVFVNDKSSPTFTNPLTITL